MYHKAIAVLMRCGATVVAAAGAAAAAVSE